MYDKLSRQGILSKSTMREEIENINNWKESQTNTSDLYMWVYVSKMHSAFLNAEMDFLLISDYEKPDKDINQFDFQYIAQVAESLDTYIERAIESIKEELAKNPDDFGIKKEQVAGYLKIPNKDFPVAKPNVIFYPGKEMFLQFYEAGFPNADYGAGIGITFKNDMTVDVWVVVNDESNVI